ncbi:MAG: Calx-beta domain-containing protein [Bacteroidales bacterium]
MRNILKFLIIGVLVIIASCDNLNEVPEFSDSDAFVAFDKAALGINENGATLSIPVTLASISGMSQSVTYSVIDSTAKEGVNFTLVDASKTLTFDAENRTQNIVLNVIDNPGVFTGDLIFQIQLAEDGTVKPSAQNICEVKIYDLDHPLASILGTWTAKGTSYFNGETSWDILFEKDAEDVSIVWISNFVQGGSGLAVYGIVNEDMTEIKVPAYQEIATSSSYPLIRLEGWFGPEGDITIPQGGNITIEIAADKSSMSIMDWFGSHVWNDAGATSSAGWYNIFEADVVLTR